MLLNDDELANLERQGPSNAIASKKTGKRSGTTTDETSQAVRDLWTEEGDDFFGHSGPPASAAVPDGAEDEDATPGPGATNNRTKKKRGAPSGPRAGRKPGPPKGSKRKAAGDSLPDDL